MLRQLVRGAYHVGPSVSRRAFSAVTARRLDYGGPNDKVNFFEQDAPGSKKRRKIDPEAEENEERGEVEEELTKLQQELKVLEKGPFAPDSPFILGLPEDDRKIALEALRKYDEEHGSAEQQYSLDEVFDDELDNMLKEEFEGLALEQENWQDSARERRKLAAKRPSALKATNKESQAYAIRFKKALQKFTENESDERTRQEVWKSYRRCKQAMPGFISALPPNVLDIVWESQATAQLSKATRSTHLQTLAEDARSIDRPLATPQILSYIDALHQGGATTQALEQWESYQAELSKKKEDLEEYWMQGVRLFAAESNPQRAQDIALAFLANDKSRQPRVLIPVITAWGRMSGKDAEVKAWALYLQLKTMLGPDMTMEDYDQVSIGLLTAGRLDTAVAIFKDMMVTGQDPANDSTAVYQAALGLAGNLHASSIDEHAVNKVSLSALTMLPRRFQNRFFYASWMKKLIGMGEVDSAALVIELMYERGVRPDSKHLNGLIGGWLREGSASARDKAERLAWSMIQHRIDAAWKRFQPVEPTPRVQVKHNEAEAARIPKFMKREVPHAGIETFSILLLYYTRRGDDDMVKYLVKCLGDAHIQPNSYFMNHLLYAELRKQDIRSLWTKFKVMSTSVQPDLETYACLWDCAKLQYDRGRTAFDSGFPSARELYGNMVQWYSQLSPRAQKTTSEQFSKELYDQIVRCFCLSKDLPGTLVTLQSMRASFGFAPDETTARMIVLQVARLAGVPAGTPKHRLRRLSSTPRSKESIAQVGRLLELLGHRKEQALKAQGLDLEQLDPHEAQEYQVEIMSSLLRIVMARTDDLGPERIESKLTRAAHEMQVSGIDLGSALGVEDSKLL
ncbi:hypothetical protein N7448_008248 [Penicillium atrosanguineum]|uniref:Pentatricopeptide repeat protein n=1 Tax=Penicillium atrosanguineum TaxID=1132637 RepID=A0A9W9GR75_9EURO|nr:hypothetical protein N7448_008248 [Penicillium atrosanguineum]KAJ5331025.1 hypothetical protein N7476_000808 [Penicillium atrosanguineum]